MFDENCLTLEFDRHGNFQMLLIIIYIITQRYWNTIKIGIDAFAIVSGSATWKPSSLIVVLIELRFFSKNAVDIRPCFFTLPNGSL